MKFLESLKVFLLLCLALTAAYAVYIYHSERYELVTAVDKVYLIDKRTGATYYPAEDKGQVQWRIWVRGR
ncbi:MAG TPA: hypothetical protein VGE15_10240 [Sphingobacteriaceae bacterium]